MKMVMLSDTYRDNTGSAVELLRTGGVDASKSLLNKVFALTEAIRLAQILATSNAFGRLGGAGRHALPMVSTVLLALFAIKRFGVVVITIGRVIRATHHVRRASENRLGIGTAGGVRDRTFMLCTSSRRGSTGRGLLELGSASLSRIVCGRHGCDRENDKQEEEGNSRSSSVDCHCVKFPAEASKEG